MKYIIAYNVIIILHKLEDRNFKDTSLESITERNHHIGIVCVQVKVFSYDFVWWYLGFLTILRSSNLIIIKATVTIKEKI